jgi:AraC-like DNA-binding protein
MSDHGRRYPVDPRLEGILGHFYLITTPEDVLPQVSHLSPSLEMMVVFNFGAPVAFSFGDRSIGEHTIDRIGILGPLRLMMNYELPPGADLLVLPFVLDGFYRFLSTSPDNELLQEEYLNGQAQRLEEIWHLLAGIRGPEKRIAALTDYLLLNISQSENPSRQLLDHVEDIHNPMVNPVKVIAGKYDVSERAIQLRFKKYAGYSPKELIRFLRFKQVVAYLLDHPAAKVNWFDMIVQFGYHDQSHLIKDFRYYTGITPQQFVQLNKDGNFCVGRE